MLNFILREVNSFLRLVQMSNFLPALSINWHFEWALAEGTTESPQRTMHSRTSPASAHTQTWQVVCSMKTQKWRTQPQSSSQPGVCLYGEVWQHGPLFASGGRNHKRPPFRIQASTLVLKIRLRIM